MFDKLIFVVTIVIQAIHGQYINGYSYPNSLATDAALVNAYSIPNPVYDLQRAANSVNGGTFVVKSSSALAPNGVSVQSDNLLVEGPVAVTGQLPFLGVVSLEGPLPATGSGAVNYNCGNGNVGIVNENEAISNAATPNGYANVLGNVGFNTALGNTGLNVALSNVGFNTALGNAGFNAGLGNAGFNAGLGNAGYNAGLGNAGYNAGLGNAGYNAGLGNANTFSTGYIAGGIGNAGYVNAANAANSGIANAAIANTITGARVY